MYDIGLIQIIGIYYRLEAIINLIYLGGRGDKKRQNPGFTDATPDYSYC